MIVTDQGLAGRRDNRHSAVENSALACLSYLGRSALAVAPIVLPAAMVRALKEAAARRLVSPSNHPTVRFLREAGYLVQGENAGRRGVTPLWQWEITEEGRDRLARRPD